MRRLSTDPFFLGHVGFSSTGSGSNVDRGSSFIVVSGAEVSVFGGDCGSS